MNTITITRIAPESTVTMDTKGFYALREDCITWEEMEDLDAYTLYASSCNGELYAPIDGLYQEAVRDSRLSGGWGVSTGSGLAAMRPRYTVEIGGEDVHLAPAYPGEYKSRTPSTY